MQLGCRFNWSFLSAFNNLGLCLTMVGLTDPVSAEYHGLMKSNHFNSYSMSSSFFLTFECSMGQPVIFIFLMRCHTFEPSCLLCYIWYSWQSYNLYRPVGYLCSGFLLEWSLVPEDHWYLPWPLWMVPGLGRLRLVAIPLHIAGNSNSALALISFSFDEEYRKPVGSARQYSSLFCP